jgi:hypothetical protein
VPLAKEKKMIPLNYDDFRIDCGSAKLEIKGFLLLVVVAGCFFH